MWPCYVCSALRGLDFVWLPFLDKFLDVSFVILNQSFACLCMGPSVSYLGKFLSVFILKQFVHRFEYTQVSQSVDTH